MPQSAVCWVALLFSLWNALPVMFGFTIFIRLQIICNPRLVFTGLSGADPELGKAGVQLEFDWPPTILPSI